MADLLLLIGSDVLDILGKRVKIVGKHPHSDEFGIVDRVEKTAFGKTGLIIKLDSCPHGTNECFVFSHENILFIG